MLELILAAAATLSPPDIRPSTFRAIRWQGDSTSIELFVDPEGVVLKCDVLYPELSEQEAKKVCDPLIGRDVGKGATDSAGNHVHSSIVLTRTMRGERRLIPKTSDFEILVNRLPNGVERVRVELQVLLSKAGEVQECQATTKKSEELARVACSQASLHRFPTENGLDGNPVQHLGYITADFVAEGQKPIE